MTRRATFTEIVDWIEGRLPAERGQGVADAVRRDDEAAEAAAWVEDFLATTERLKLEAPPSDLRGELRAMFREPANFPADQGWTRARLLYDTREPRVAGVRGPDTPGQSHLAFDSDAGRFVLETGPASAGHVELRGLLLTERAPVAAEVTLLEGGVVRRRAVSTSDGRFEFDQVPVVVDELRISLDGVRVAAPLELG
ncbi:hypothetical protein [Nocardioides nitrophenolicus]|uniref:hypothetical protein n=1 Tax=Nocardioides nitrophenolicus TaxID=60489 RepID=UPI00195E06EA|nr:hypothetical protein [Nocardioides nitrophenolicus]MBM7520285.1 hypothetical protein [Nocardioides nitrophenolicus]